MENVTSRACKRCGKEFFLNRKDKTYCSRICKQRECKRKNHKYSNSKSRKAKKGIFLMNIRKEQCSFCGFIPIHSVQLEIDHIDGNHDNNTISNLQVLCANCHKLKTLMNNEFGSKNKLKIVS